MNYLAHLFLAHTDPDEQLGSIIADFTRGRLETLAKDYSSGIVRGIGIHRKVDLFTDQHPAVIASKAYFSKERRRYAGIILDVFYDHLLSRHWARYSPGDRHLFIGQMYHLMQQNYEQLPTRLQRLLPRMVASDWLGSYEDVQILALVFERMATRLRSPNRLAGSLEEIEAHYAKLETQFLMFFPDLVSFAEGLNQQRGSPL